MARILIVGGGERGLWLVSRLGERGHTARVLTRGGDRRQAIEAAGAECRLGDPDRLGTLIGALEGVTIACWLLGCASGEQRQVAALHDLRLRSFLTKTIDTTVRGVVYEAAGTLPSQLLQDGARIASEVTRRNEIPLAVLRADPADRSLWRDEALAAIECLLATG
jgi:uncharacterized protein YbjT (DUF2867 family)